jgi:uncharacterized protein DUF6152
MNRLPVVLSMLAALQATAAFAHHGVAAYDMKVVETVDGIVEAWDWQKNGAYLAVAVVCSSPQKRCQGAKRRPSGSLLSTLVRNTRTC